MAIPGNGRELWRITDHERTGLPRFQLIWSAFDLLVRRKFGSSTPIDKKTGFADARALIAMAAARGLSSGVDTDYPPVIYETEFVHLALGGWRPFNKDLKGVLGEAQFVEEVKWFFEEFCRSNEYTLAGIEEPRTATRRFSRVNYFTLEDDIRIDVDAGDLYVANRSDNGWTLIYSELLICPSADFGELSEILNGVSQVQEKATAELKSTNYQKAARRSREGKLLVWKLLKAWKEREPNLFDPGVNKAFLARELSEHPDLASYSPETVETYVRQVMSDPDF